MKFSKATKYNSFLKLGLAGPPGSGKSYSALNIAQHLSEKRVAVIDAEMGAASKYANLFDFDVLELTLDDEGRDIAKPYSPQRYMEAIKAAYDTGEYDVLIIDGISPEWDDAGGCLQWVDQITRNNDTRAAWKTVSPVHKQFINSILRVRMHVICTMLAKKEMVANKDSNNKIIGKKVTLDPIQREDVPRVFDVFALMQDKEMIIDKTRCPELDDQVILKPGKEVADILREWLKGDPMPERPEYGPETDSPAPTVAAPATKDIYVKGGKKGLWANPSGFYAFACAELGVTVSQDTKLTPEQRLQLDKAIDEEAPIQQVQPQKQSA